MKSFLAAVAASLLIAFGASYVLNAQYQTTAPEAFTTSGARITSPGNNLVTF